MTQNWTIDVYAAGHTGQTDLQNMENNFTTLKSLFSGASQPVNAVGGMPWYDISNNVLKIRNAGNSAWYRQMHGDASQKIWIYRNTAMNGWAIDSAITDKVLSLKGGSQAYNTSAGSTAGSWIFSGGSPANHTLTEAELPAISGYLDFCQSAPNLITGSSGKFSLGTGAGTNEVTTSSAALSAQRATFSFGSGNAHGHSFSHDGTWRPAAAIGTLQYMLG